MCAFMRQGDDLDVANFSAEGGHNVANVNAATRAGTSQYHGTAFDYLNNSALNAVNTITKTTVPNFVKPLLQKNQFGGNLGGPLWLPKKIFGPLGHDVRDRLFFFANYERTIQNTQGNTRIARVPTERERQGDFGELLARFPNDPNFVIYNPFSTTLNASGNSLRTPVPGNDLRRVTRPRALRFRARHVCWLASGRQRDLRQSSLRRSSSSSAVGRVAPLHRMAGQVHSSSATRGTELPRSAS